MFRLLEALDRLNGLDEEKGPHRSKAVAFNRFVKRVVDVVRKSGADVGDVRNIRDGLVRFGYDGDYYDVITRIKAVFRSGKKVGNKSYEFVYRYRGYSIRVKPYSIAVAITPGG